MENTDRYHGLKPIPLTKGYVAYVDPEDFELVNQWKWCAKVHPTKRTIYAARTYRRKNPDGSSTQICVKLHRFLMNAQTGHQIDHIDCDGLNNSRKNLRFCRDGENQRNVTKRRGKNTSRYKGVSWDKDSGKWLVQIRHDGRQWKIGRYDSEQEAAASYDEAAKRHHRDFARINEVVVPDLDEGSPLIHFE